MKKFNLWLGFGSLILLCVFIYQLRGDTTGKFVNSPVSVGKMQVDESTASHNGHLHYGSDTGNLKSEDKTSNAVSNKSNYGSVIEFESESVSDFPNHPRTDKDFRPSSQEYQAFLQDLNSVPLPKGRLVIQVNSEAGVALANRYREQRRAAKRHPVRSFSSDENNLPTNPRQTAIESSIASYNSKSSLTIPTRVTNFTSSRPSYTSQSSTQASTQSTTDQYYDPSYRPSVGNHYVSGYMRRDGTVVKGHFKTNSDDSYWNNWSSYGNINPMTGRIGTRRPSYSYGGGSTFVSGYYRSNGTHVRGHHRRK